MKIKTKGKEVNAVKGKNLGHSVVYSLEIDGLKHNVTLGLDGANPLQSLKDEAEKLEKRAKKRAENLKALKDAGL